MILMIMFRKLQSSLHLLYFYSFSWLLFSSIDYSVYGGCYHFMGEFFLLFKLIYSLFITSKNSQLSHFTLIIINVQVSLWMENESSFQDMISIILTITFLLFSYNEVMPRVSYLKVSLILMFFGFFKFLISSNLRPWTFGLLFAL